MMGTSSRGKRSVRKHSSMMGMRLSSTKSREVLRTSSSSSVKLESRLMRSKPWNLKPMMYLPFFGNHLKQAILADGGGSEQGTGTAASLQELADEGVLAPDQFV